MKRDTERKRESGEMEEKMKWIARIETQERRAERDTVCERERERERDREISRSCRTTCNQPFLM